MASHGFVLSLTHTMTSLLAGHRKFTKRGGCMHALLLYKTLSVFCTAHTRHHTPWHRKRRPRPPRFSARLQLCHGATVRSYCPSPLFNGLIGLKPLQKPHIREMTLLFIYFESCHYNSMYNGEMPVSTLGATCGPPAGCIRVL